MLCFFVVVFQMEQSTLKINSATGQEVVRILYLGLKYNSRILNITRSHVENNIIIVKTDCLVLILHIQPEPPLSMHPLDCYTDVDYYSQVKRIGNEENDYDDVFEKVILQKIISIKFYLQLNQISVLIYVHRLKR